MRSNSVRRTPRTAATAFVGSSCRRAEPRIAARMSARIARRRARRRPRASAAPRARGRASSRRSGSCRARTRVARRPCPRRAAACRYHGVAPSWSDTCRYASSPPSGSGASAKSESRTGSSVRCRAARRDTPGRHRLDVLQRARRIVEPERGEPPARLVRAQPQAGCRHARDRLEQRPVEQLLVQSPHLARVQLPLRLPDRAGVAPRVRAEAHRQRQPVEVGAAVGDEMGAPQSP